MNRIVGQADYEVQIATRKDALPMYENYRKIEDTVAKLQTISGYDLYELLQKFMAGWKLTPPEGNIANKTISSKEQLERYNNIIKRI